MTDERDLWDAIEAYVKACGGEPSPDGFARVFLERTISGFEESAQADAVGDYMEDF